MRRAFNAMSVGALGMLGRIALILIIPGVKL
jgi:hypothetical protein